MLPKERTKDSEIALARATLAFDRPTGRITIQSAYDGKFSTRCCLPQRSPENRLRSPPALRTIKKIRAEVGRNSWAVGKSPLTLPTLKNLFADCTGKHSRFHKERKATTQRANGKKSEALRVRMYLGA